MKMWGKALEDCVQVKTCYNEIYYPLDDGSTATFHRKYYTVIPERGDPDEYSPFDDLCLAHFKGIVPKNWFMALDRKEQPGYMHQLSKEDKEYATKLFVEEKKTVQEVYSIMTRQSADSLHNPDQLYYLKRKLEEGGLPKADTGWSINDPQAK